MKYLILLLLPLSAFALDPLQPVAQEIDGELVNYRKALPKTYKGISNYHKGSDRWEADGWVQAKRERVTVTNQVNRIGTEAYSKETNMIARVASALEVIAPERPGFQTLQLIQNLPPSQFISLAKARFKGDKTKQADILAASLEIFAIFNEAKSAGVDYTSPELGQPIKNEVTTISEIKKVNQ